LGGQADKERVRDKHGGEQTQKKVAFNVSDMEEERERLNESLTLRDRVSDSHTFRDEVPDSQGYRNSLIDSQAFTDRVPGSHSFKGVDSFRDGVSDTQTSKQTQPLRSGDLGERIMSRYDWFSESQTSNKAPSLTGSGGGMGERRGQVSMGDRLGPVTQQQPALPFEDQMVEPPLSSFSQEALISRVCKLESMLQALKVGVAGATSGIGNSGSSVDKRRLRAEVEEKLALVRSILCVQSRCLL
jgi:hypothetical protein